METRESEEERERIQSVKGAINFYGEIPGQKKIPIEISEKKPPSKTKELHFAQKDINQFSKSWKTSESIRTQAESELVNARQTVKDLTLLIEESNLKTNAQRKELETLKKSNKSQEKLALDVGKSDSANEYAEARKELQSLKQELCQLKLDMAHAMEMKVEANKKTDAAISRIRSCSRTIDTLRKEIEEANEEQVLVELARIEAVREFGVIKAQREAEGAKFINKMEKIKSRMKDMIQEIDRTKELEITLAITNSEVGVLQSELKLVKAMEIRSVVEKAPGEEENSNKTHTIEGKTTTLSLLQSVTEEMEASKKELARIKRGGFKLMASMDIIREECKSVNEETARLKKAEKETDATVQNLNTKLLRAKNRLEAASSAEEKSISIVSNLSTTLQQLKSESDTAKRESGKIREEMVGINEEKQKNEFEIKLTEEKLQSAVQELELVKSSEAIALEKLKTLAEKTVKTRASKSQHSSSVTISKFEYEYLMGRAKRAEAVAEMKVVAAEAWIEAVKVGEKEMELKREMAEREIRELSLMEDQELYRTVKSMRESLESETEIHSGRQLQEEILTKIQKNSQLEEALPSKAVKEYGNTSSSAALLSKAITEYGTATPSRRARVRVPGSPGGRHLIHSGAITLRRRRKKVVPNLINKLFSSNNKNLMNDDQL